MSVSMKGGASRKGGRLVQFSILLKKKGKGERCHTHNYWIVNLSQLLQGGVTEVLESAPGPSSSPLPSSLHSCPLPSPLLLPPLPLPPAPCWLHCQSARLRTGRAKRGGRRAPAPASWVPRGVGCAPKSKESKECSREGDSVMGTWSGRRLELSEFHNDKVTRIKR